MLHTIMTFRNDKIHPDIYIYARVGLGHIIKDPPHAIALDLRAIAKVSIAIANSLV